MAEPKLITARPPAPASCGATGSTVWWISRVAFQTRNRPPAMRIRSRQEKPWPKAVKIGAVSCTITAMVARSPSRRTRARPMPIRRARACWSAGSLLVRMEMKIRLSMPSTISITTSVARAA